MRKIVMSAAMVVGLGGTVALASAGPAAARPLAQPDGSALVQLAAQHAAEQAQELRYEPSKRDREGDDEEQDEPRH
ncbi:conserved exported hypothetical protein [Bradyrhizobium sp. ORS 375]|uniref:hypothetical protein n=1 Tax=Bradyrhizobium sp. (strain ORS 375) TaxID=566679 RepID=UPI0002408BAE|nr:hypothetical protein [Bradyrhizobium sp. ORS 375]CCD96533.1 conserved exported hypothetical protein [Bradyrhizobium sp. ORS 375]